MKDVLLGLWSAVRIAAQVGWEYTKKWWNKASVNQRTIVVLVVAVILMIGMVRCVAAQPNADSGFGLVVGGGGYGAACYVENGVPETGMVTPCLLGILGPNNQLLIDGNITFCTVTGIDTASVPTWECAPSFSEAKAKTVGI